MATVFTADKQTRQASQENVRDAFSANLGEQLVNIPENEDDFQERKGAWKNFFSTIRNNPQAQQFLITAGLTMASGAGMGAGDDDVDNLRNSVKAGLTAVGNYHQLQEQERQRQFTEQQSALNNISARQLQAAQADQLLRSGPTASDIYGSGSGVKQDNLAELAWKLAREEADTIYGEAGDPSLKQAHINAQYPNKLKSLQTQSARGVFTPTGKVEVEDEEGDTVPVDTQDAQFASLVSALETGYDAKTGKISGNFNTKKAIAQYGAALDEETLALAQDIAILNAKGEVEKAEKLRAEHEDRQRKATVKELYETLSVTPDAKAAYKPSGQYSWSQPSAQENLEYLQQIEAFKASEYWNDLTAEQKKQINAKEAQVRKQIGE